MNRVKADRQNTNPLTMKLNGTLDAAVQGGVANFDVSGNIPCVCVCVFGCISVCTCVHVYTCTIVHVYVCVVIVLCVHMYVYCTCVQLYIYMYNCTCTCTCTCVCGYSSVCTYVCVLYMYTIVCM